jgi:transcriptional regulator with XRE-family HTH domain
MVAVATPFPNEMASTGPSAGAVLTKATIRATDRLGLSQKTLSQVLGISESLVSRMRRGTFVLERGKAFELAVLFVRLYLSLDAIVGGDEKSSCEWMRHENLALRAKPIDLIRKVHGLIYVIQYLDARRAVV